MSESADEKNGNPIEEQIEEALKASGQVREEVHRIVLGAFETGEASIGRLMDLTRQALDAAVGGLGSISESDRAKRLEDTIAGLGDAFTAALNATGLALEEAKSKGEKFATEDLNSTLEELQTLESLFVETISNLAKRSSSAVTQSSEDLVEHSKRIAEQFRPAVGTAISALKTHPKEVAEGATSLIASVLTGALQGAADALKDAGKKG